MFKKIKSAVVVGLLAALACGAAVAGADTTFTTVQTTLTGWMTGSLGTVFALGALIVGLAIGVVKQSIMAVTVGIAVALATSMGPTVIGGIVTAAL